MVAAAIVLVTTQGDKERLLLRLEIFWNCAIGDEAMLDLKGSTGRGGP